MPGIIQFPKIMKGNHTYYYLIKIQSFIQRFDLACHILQSGSDIYFITIMKCRYMLFVGIPCVGYISRFFIGYILIWRDIPITFIRHKKSSIIIIKILIVEKYHIIIIFCFCNVQPFKCHFISFAPINIKSTIYIKTCLSYHPIISIMRFDDLLNPFYKAPFI